MIQHIYIYMYTYDTILYIKYNIPIILYISYMFHNIRYIYIYVNTYLYIYIHMIYDILYTTVSIVWDCHPG